MFCASEMLPIGSGTWWSKEKDRKNVTSMGDVSSVVAASMGTLFVLKLVISDQHASMGAFFVFVSQDGHRTTTRADYRLTVIPHREYVDFQARSGTIYPSP